MSADPVVITTSGPAPPELVTEAEYAAREAERPPSGGGSSFGVTVTTEAQLRSALPIGGRIHVNVNGVLPLTVPEVIQFSAPGTVLVGLGKHTTELETKVENPNQVAYWMAAKNLTLRDITLNSNYLTWHCVYGDCSREMSGLVLDNVLIKNPRDGFKYVGHIAYPPCRGLTFRNSDIIGYSGFGMNIDCDVADPVIEGFNIEGLGPQKSFTALWIGQGILGGRIAHGKITNSGYNGLECFYPQVYPTKSQLSRDNPFGAGMTISDIEIDGAPNIACSLAGCKRSVVSNITIRNVGAGMEYIDEINAQDGKTLWSDYNASGVTVANCVGVGVTIHRLKRGQFSNHVVTDCGQFGVQIYDGADRVTFRDSYLARCADRMLFCNGAPGTTVVDCEFHKAPGDPATCAYFAYGGSHIFTRNTLRGGLHSRVLEATVTVAPGVLPQRSGEIFTDSHNFRLPN